jgi:hypothetical protein
LKRELAPNFRVDTYFFQYHGTFVTHEDALCHYTFDDHVYNERPLNTKDCFPGIDNLKNGIVTRWILVDIPRLKGVPYLEPDAAVFQKDIEAWEKMAGVKVTPGDAVILRTGRWARREKKGPWNAIATAAGFDVTVAPWFKARDVALAGGAHRASPRPPQNNWIFDTPTSVVLTLDPRMWSRCLSITEHCRKSISPAAVSSSAVSGKRICVEQISLVAISRFAPARRLLAAVRRIFRLQPQICALVIHTRLEHCGHVLLARAECGERSSGMPNKF